MEKYHIAKGKSREIGEHSDCSVVAFSIVTGISYTEMHQIFNFAGRPDRNRTPWATTDKVVEHLKNNGYTIESSQPRRIYERYGREIHGRYSLLTIGKILPKGHYVVHVRGHALALIDGEVQDWSTDSKRLVNEVLLITPPEK